MFVAEESDRGRLLMLEQLLIIQYLLRYPEIDTTTAARITQQGEPEAHEALTQMEAALGYLERGGTGRGTYWMLRPDLHRILSTSGHPERDRRIDWEAAKTRVLSILMERARRGEKGFTNKEIRQINHFNRHQVTRMLLEMRAENQDLQTVGHGAGARYEWKQK
jgi:ATP-dependent DNA helicase RecG